MQLPEGLSIRCATPEDAEAVLAHCRIVGAETDNLSYGAEGLAIAPEAFAASLGRTAENPRSLFLVAEDGGKIVGTANLSGSPKERLRHRAEVGIAVQQAWWGQGLGRALMERLLAFAREAGFRIVYLEVRSDSERAIALYEHLGFERTGCFRGYFQIGGELVDFDLMELMLGSC